MSIDVYRQIPGINWSTLKHMGKSPLAYKHEVDNGHEDTDAMALGRYTHALVFQPEIAATEYAVHDGTFPIDYVVYDEGDRRGHRWKAFEAANQGRMILKPAEAEELEAWRKKVIRHGPIWAAFKAANEGKDLFTESEAKAARGMAEAVRNHPLVKPYLAAEDGVFEEILQWVDKETGQECKARLDWHIRSRRVLLDLKTCPSIDVYAFGKTIARFEYHCQLAHYRNGLEEARGWTPSRQLFVAVEKVAPHDVLVCELEQDAKDLGRDTVRELLFKVAACRESGIWPGRYTEEQPARLPIWVYGGETQIEFEGEAA